MTQPLLMYPAGARFTCSQCGDCCRDWNVPVAAGERERLAAIDWRGRADPLVGVTPAREVKIGGASRWRLARRDDGACVYLGRDHDCLLHTHFGAAAKPLACALYPFSFLALDAERVAVDVAYSCRAVSLGSGAALGEHEARLSELARGPARPTPPSRHRLTRARDASAEVVIELESQLLAYLRDPSLRLLDRMRCCIEYLRLVTTGDPATPAAALLRSTIGRALPEQIRKRPFVATPLDDAQRAVLGLWTYLVLNLPPVDLPEWPARRQKREGERRAALADAFRQRQGQPWLADRELEVSFETIDAVSLHGLRAEGEAIVGSFLEAKILGQRFRRAGDDEVPLVDGLERLFLCYPIAMWASRALAAARGASAAETSDLRSALRLLDRSLGELRTSVLAKRQREAWDFVIGDLDLALMAAAEMLG